MLWLVCSSEEHSWKAVLLFMMGFAFCACGDDESYTLGVWHRRSDFDGLARGSAAGFTIADKGYVCGGYRYYL